MLGKFRGCFTLLLIAIACTLPLPLTVDLIAELDWGPVVGGYVGALLLGAALVLLPLVSLAAEWICSGFRGSADG